MLFCVCNKLCVCNVCLIGYFVYLTRLVVLVLQNTGVSDDGLQKLTTPARMFGKGPIGLTHLDVSCTLFVLLVNFFLFLV